MQELIREPGFAPATIQRVIPISGNDSAPMQEFSQLLG